MIESRNKLWSAGVSPGGGLKKVEKSLHSILAMLGKSVRDAFPESIQQSAFADAVSLAAHEAP